MVVKILLDSLGLDKSKFLITQLISLIIGLAFRQFVKASPKNVVKRHVIEILLGLCLGYFCFDNDFFHLISIALISLFLMKTCPRNNIHIIVFAFTIIYLSCVHLYFQIYFYGQKNFDITSPLMIFVQKLTYLAFSYSDGLKAKESLNDYQKLNVLNEFPSMLEYFSYLFHFQGIIIGPGCNYKDYIEFIDGTNIRKHHEKTFARNLKPSVRKALFKKILMVLIMSVIFFKFSLVYPFTSNIDPIILSSPFWYRILYLHFTCEGQRLYYYIPWTLSDAVNNASGFGFNGYDDKGESKWDLLTNINILELETSTSIKHVIDNWHIQSNIWLRRVLYERLPKGKTLGVFFISSLWHGFYPGYYFSLVFSAIVVYVGRGIRRNIRPMFQNKYLSLIYSIIGWIITQLLSAYMMCPFFLLKIESSIKFLNSFYWIGHIIIFILIFILPKQSFKSKSS
ncbi:unnamed protein product [Brachionus calyciflorus]|uniref:Uncharacterized protein n=1 Tax=Brachionus calyciflorus TaxID=104777 RepID=A0A814C6L7_9BILA|nr:unnamed protein product [Brachionus calyciflorus]